MNTSITTLNGIKFEYFTNDCMATSCVGKNEEWESHITNFVKIYNKIFNITNIIDVGANFGYHTLFFSKEVECNVFAFEPQIQNFMLLKNNIEYNEIKNVICYNLECGDKRDDVKMPVFENESTVNMGDFTPTVLTTNKYSITKSVLLDDINFEKIDLIKIDVQGWEKKVLQGAYNLLNKYKPALIVEVEWFQLQKTNTLCKELFDFIKNNNYHIYFLDYSYPSDHVCIHNDKLDEFKNKFKNYIFPHTTDNNLNNNIQYGVNEKIII